MYVGKDAQIRSFSPFLFGRHLRLTCWLPIG
nr:MAG TPA: hypothetical protein [Caudoviricetes sp.]DAW93234.1 MAG TPA: hypothetical protein [Caudoviricetes sp.]